MKNDSIEEKSKSKKFKGRKRGKRIDDSESEEASNEKDNSIKKRKYSKDEIDSQDESKINQRNEKQLELQKKLKFIVNEVREKGKYEYNKQEIPENLKYHSDESDSSLSRTLNNKSIKDKINCIEKIYNNIGKEMIFHYGINDESNREELKSLFNYIVIKAQPKRMISNINYIKCFENYNEISSKSLTLLESSKEFLNNITHEHAGVTKEKFDKNMNS